MKPRGFTLVELLVVIAMIALLAGLSMSGFRSSREQARKVACTGRIRQLLLGTLNYETENGTFSYGFRSALGSLGSVERYAGSPGSVDLPGWWWFDYSEKVDHATGQREELLICPSKRQDHLTLARDLLCGNYGANLSVFQVDGYTQPYKDGFGGRPLSLARIPQPAQTLLLVDSGYSLISWWHATVDPPVELPPAVMMAGMILNGAYVPGMGINKDESKTQLSGQTRDALGGRHPNKTVNVGFADGSIASKKADDLFVAQSGEDHWDSGPLWQPDGDTITFQTASP
jgi:prepilin-type N-terminal cleavage/methylation domain-containing protein/prepilin-type processing-associated H-X9-DG protein